MMILPCLKLKSSFLGVRPKFFTKIRYEKPFFKLMANHKYRITE